MAKSSGETTGQMSAFLRRLLGASGKGASGGVTLPRASLPKVNSEGTRAVTDTAPHTMPRQLSSEEYAARTGAATTGGSGWGSLGSLLLSPLAGVGSLLGELFGSSAQTRTRYREETRQPFHLVEAISPETKAAIAPLNEAASGLFGVAASGVSTSNLSQTLMNERQAVTSAVVRSVGESGAIGNTLNEYQDGL
jgi:hypothetical protein